MYYGDIVNQEIIKLKVVSYILGDTYISKGVLLEGMIQYCKSMNKPIINKLRSYFEENTPEYTLHVVNALLQIEKTTKYLTNDNMIEKVKIPTKVKKSIDSYKHTYNLEVLTIEEFYLQALKPYVIKKLQEDYQEFSLEVVAGGCEDKAQEIEIKKTKSKVKFTSTNYLKKYGYNMTLKVLEDFDDVIGREKEILQVVNILLQRYKCNPVLIGEAGTGKSKLVEGVAHYIATEKEVPLELRNKEIISINIGSLIGGTKYRGDLEERVVNIMEEAIKCKNYILFFDEMHTLRGGASEDAVGIPMIEIMKPYLARGDISIIGATTLEEYNTLEQDKAFKRRVSNVYIKEPGLKEMLNILQLGKLKYEEYHKVDIDDSLCEKIVQLSDRYIKETQQPDKTFTLLDKVCVKAKVRRRKLNEVVKVEIQDLYDVLTDISGVPYNEDTQKQKLKGLAEKLKSKVYGQDRAIDSVTRVVQRGYLKISNPNRPLGVIMFQGKTGTGKTEIAKVLSEELYGKGSLIRIDMSEYKNGDSINKLLGATAGYIGYTSESHVFEKVRKNPYSVVLLDEIEKATEEIHNLLLQVFEEGELKDNKGRVIDFRNTVIIMTTNAGVSTSKKAGFNAESVEIANISKYFKAEFLNRVDDIILFDTMTESTKCQIAEKYMQELLTRLKKVYDFKVEYTKELVEYLSQTDISTYGAREIRRKVEQEVETAIVNHLMLEEDIQNMCIDVNKEGQVKIKELVGV